MLKKSTLMILVLAFAGTCIAQNKKVAVVTFYVNKYIGTDQLGGAASLVSGVATLAEDPDFDLTSVLNNFHDTFFDEYAQTFPFELLPEEEVIGNPDYQAYESIGGETSDVDREKFFQQYIAYEGYKPLAEYILAGKNRNEKQMLEIFKDQVDGVMFVYLDYNFVRGMLGVTANVQAYARMKLWNKEGKRVFALNEFATSKKSVAAVGGIPVMDTKELLPLCEDASERLMADLGKKIGKIVKKANKKL